MRRELVNFNGYSANWMYYLSKITKSTSKWLKNIAVMFNLRIPFVTVSSFSPGIKSARWCSLFSIKTKVVLSTFIPWSWAIVGESHISDTNVIEHSQDGQVALYHVAAFEANQGCRLSLAVGTPDI